MGVTSAPIKGGDQAAYGTLLKSGREGQEDETSPFITLVVRIQPAAGQRLTGRKDQVGFNQSLRLLQLLTGMQPTLHAAGERIKQLRQAQHLHDRAIGAGSQEHEAWEEGAPGLIRASHRSEA